MKWRPQKKITGKNWFHWFFFDPYKWEFMGPYLYNWFSGAHLVQEKLVNTTVVRQAESTDSHFPPSRSSKRRCGPLKKNPGLKSLAGLEILVGQDLGGVKWLIYVSTIFDPELVWFKTGWTINSLIFGKEESPLQKLLLFIKHVHTNFTGQRKLLLGKPSRIALALSPGACCRFVMRQRSNHHGSLRKTSPNPSSKSRNQEQYWFVQGFLKLSPEHKDKFCHSFGSYRYTSKCPIGNGALEPNIDFWCHAVCYQQWLGNLANVFHQQARIHQSKVQVAWTIHFHRRLDKTLWGPVETSTINTRPQKPTISTGVFCGKMFVGSEAEDWCLISLAWHLPRMSHIFVYTLGHFDAIFASACFLFICLVPSFGGWFFGISPVKSTCCAGKLVICLWQIYPGCFC